MDWTNEDISDRPFTYYEIENDSRALTGFHVYCRVASLEYSSLDDIDKISYILSTSDLVVSDIQRELNVLPDGLDTSDFETLKTIIVWW